MHCQLNNHPMFLPRKGVQPQNEVPSKTSQRESRVGYVCARLSNPIPARLWSLHPRSLRAPASPQRCATAFHPPTAAVGWSAKARTCAALRNYWSVTGVNAGAPDQQRCYRKGQELKTNVTDPQSAKMATSKGVPMIEPASLYRTPQTLVTGHHHCCPGNNLIQHKGEAYKPLSRLPQQAVQSNMVYQPREV